MENFPSIPTVIPMAPMDILKESDDLNKVYYLYGVASHHCSNIEYRIVTLLLGQTWANTKDLDHIKVKQAYENLNKKPLGALLKLYKKHYQFTEKQIEQMKLILKKRNYLIHHFWGNYGKDMHSPKTLKGMINDLEELIGLFQSASHSLAG
jgi:hypothetical protein